VNILVIIYSELELFVDVLVIDLKDAMNIGRLESVFLVKFVANQLVLSLEHVKNMLKGIML